MTVVHANASDSAESIDSFSRKALAASAIGYAMDGFDLLILGFMLRAISAELHLTPPQAGSLVTWTLIGAVAGGILFGILSDHYGRVRVLTWTILLFAVFTGLCAFAQGYWDLLIYRTIAGLGLGGEFGIGMALVAEAWPATHRARGCTYVALGWQAGVLVAALVTPLLLPVIGWRGMFLVGLIPGLIAFVVRWYLTEPKIFLERSKARKPKLPLGLLVKDAATTNISLGMLILCSVQNFGYYGLMIWLPSYLSTHFGYTLTQSALWTGTGLFSTDYSNHTSDRWCNHGHVRQWHARRLRCIAGRALSDGSSGDRGERDIQSRTWGRRFWAVRRRGTRSDLFIYRGDRTPSDHLSPGHSRHRFPHS